MNLTINPINFGHSINNTKIEPNVNISEFKIKDIKKNTLQKDISKNQYYTKNSLKTYITTGIFSEKKVDSLRERIEQQRKQLLLGDEFFIRMTGYGKNKQWAQQMEALTYSVSFAISNGLPFGEILAQIEKGVELINSTILESGYSDTSYGKRRRNHHTFALLKNTRGCEYIDRYREKSKTKNSEFTILGNTFPMYCPKSNEEYKNANVSKIGEFARFGIGEKTLGICQDSTEKYTISNLFFVRKEFNKLREIENPTADEVLRSCAIIQWLIAQETPYNKGSDSIANVLTKSIMHANNIYISPLKEGVSLDFEAFDTDLDDYIEKYPDFFEIRPYKMKD